MNSFPTGRGEWAERSTRYGYRGTAFIKERINLNALKLLESCSRLACHCDALVFLLLLSTFGTQQRGNAGCENPQSARQRNLPAFGLAKRVDEFAKRKLALVGYFTPGIARTLPSSRIWLSRMPQAMMMPRCGCRFIGKRSGTEYGNAKGPFEP